MAHESQHKTPLWENLIGLTGLIFLLAIAGYLLYEALQPSTPPAVRVATERVSSVPGGYLVEIRAVNDGGSTAASVEVEGTLSLTGDPNAEPVETSTTTFDYVPSKATRRGGLFFTENPAEYMLAVRAKGYIAP